MIGVLLARLQAVWLGVGCQPVSVAQRSAAVMRTVVAGALFGLASLCLRRLSCSVHLDSSRAVEFVDVDDVGHVAPLLRVVPVLKVLACTVVTDRPESTRSFPGQCAVALHH